MPSAAGEGLADLYGALQPILDGIVEDRMAKRVAVTKPQGIDGQSEDAGPVKLAIIGQPNVVRARAASRAPKLAQGLRYMERCNLHAQRNRRLHGQCHADGCACAVPL